ncbi:restriction endonuclease subunit S [Desulforegula conservatrix]|uniref:restriction endonuclease subunit S n=1 Tax=Desulforegula conservatrix TaxID=153026 RepID=UPI000414B5FF|nr:restriction endonuclease subunit S [Desulforegula conservatrix]
MSSDWRSYQFQELCDIKRGASPRPIHDYLGDEGMPWIKIADATAEDSRFIRTSKERIKLSGVKASVEVFPGELILSNSATPGLPKFMKINACIHDGWMILRNFKQLDKNFAYWLLLVERTNLVSQGNGSVFTNLKTDILKNYTVNIPAIDEQIRIASFFNTLDDRITLLRETNKTLEAIAQAIFKSWFVDFDPVRAKQEGREPEGMDADTAALFPDSFEESELGLIPKGWKVGTLGDISCVKGGFAYKSEVFCDAGSPVVKIKNIVGDGTVDLLDAQFIADEIANKTQKFGLKDGDIVIAMTGATIGKTGVIVTTEDQVPYLNQRVAKFDSNLQGFNNSWFIFVAFQNKFIFEQVVNAASGSAQPNISTNGIESVCLVIPDNNELMSIFNEYISVIFQGWIANQKQSKTLTQLRDTLLPRLISGQLRLPDAESMVEEAVS